MSHTYANKVDDAQERSSSKRTSESHPQFHDSRSSISAQLATQKQMHGGPQTAKQRILQNYIHNSSVVQNKLVQRADDEEFAGEKEMAQLAEAAPEMAASTESPQDAPNNTGLPNQLKSGIESISGMSMDHVKVHFNSDKPAQLNAHAYAQGSDIHVAPGQEQHLPHEAWHVVQQAQGRVKPTMQLKGDVPVNDDAGLEYEADVMGARATKQESENASINQSISPGTALPIVQRMLITVGELDKTIEDSANTRSKYAHSKGTKVSSLEALEQDAILGVSEALDIVSHGSMPEGGIFSWLRDTDVPYLDKYTADILADKLKDIFPDDYSGEVYINGCYTAIRKNGNDQGTSFIEQFYKKLCQLKPNNKAKIKGNLGVAATQVYGNELIRIKKSEAKNLPLNPYIFFEKEEEGEIWLVFRGVGGTAEIENGQYKSESLSSKKDGQYREYDDDYESKKKEEEKSCIMM